MNARFWYYLKRVEDWLAGIAILVLLAVTVSVCAGALMRYGFRAPLVWVNEFSEYGLLYLTFLGAPRALRERAHVRVDILDRFLTSTWRRRTARFAAALGFIVSLTLLVFGTIATYTAYVRGAYKPTINEVPTWLVLIVIPLGCLPLLLRFLHQLIWPAADPNDERLM